MKKSLKVTLIVIAVIIVILTIGIIDVTRVVAKQDEELLKITNTNNNLDIFAYSLDKMEDKLVITMYGRKHIIKYIQTYYIKDGIITSTSIENQYNTKLSAIVAYIQDVDWTNKKRHGNVITGVSKSSEAEIGKDVDEFISEITNAYKNFVFVK